MTSGTDNTVTTGVSRREYVKPTLTKSLALAKATGTPEPPASPSSAPA
jgi:hypothetical protein